MWYSLKSLATVSEPLDKQHETILKLFFPYAFSKWKFYYYLGGPQGSKIDLLGFLY